MSLVEKFNEVAEEALALTNAEYRKTIENLEQWITSLEGKIDKLAEIIDIMRLGDH